MGHRRPDRKYFDDLNLTDKKFAKWQGHSPERLEEMKDHREWLKAQGAEAID